MMQHIRNKRRVLPTLTIRQLCRSNNATLGELLLWLSLCLVQRERDDTVGRQIWTECRQ